METEKLYADFAARVEVAVAQAGGPSEVARKMRVTLPTLTRWRTGNADPSRTNLVKLADATGVDLVWLATGKGEMRDNAHLRAIQAVFEPQADCYMLGNQADPCFEIDLGNRIRAVADMYTSRQDAATAAGCSKQSLDKYMKGEQSPTLKTMHMLTSGVGVSLDWLASGRGQMRKAEPPLAPHDAVAEPRMLHDVISHHGAPQSVKDTLGNPVDLDEFAFIPRYSAQASAGHGADTQNCGKPLFSMAFRRYWIKHYLRADQSNLAVISVKGDSMDGVLNDRDAILIDLSDVAPTGGLYIVRLAGDLMVKRVQKMPGGRFLLLSANPAYVPAEVDPAQEADFAVVGRVVWFGRQV